MTDNSTMYADHFDLRSRPDHFKGCDQRDLFRFCCSSNTRTRAIPDSLYHQVTWEHVRLLLYTCCYSCWSQHIRFRAESQPCCRQPMQTQRMFGSTGRTLNPQVYSTLRLPSDNSNSTTSSCWPRAGRILRKSRSTHERSCKSNSSDSLAPVLVLLSLPSSLV